MNNTNLFPQVIDKSKQSHNELVEKKSEFHEKILRRYLTLKIEGWSVKDFLDSEGIKNFALYGVTHFTRLFLDDLDQNESNDVSIVICDRNAKAFSFGVKGRPVILLDELINEYMTGTVKKIIVMSIIYENEIIDELITKGVLLNDIISFVSVLYS